VSSNKTGLLLQGTYTLKYTWHFGRYRPPVQVPLLLALEALRGPVGF